MPCTCSTTDEKSSTLMKLAQTILVIFLLGGAGGGLYLWWQHGTIHPSTDDAYLQAGTVTIAPQVGGQVETVAVADNQYVAAGDVLFAIDTASLTAARDAAQAQLDIANQTAGSSSAEVSAAEAQLASANAALADASADLARQQSLFNLGDVAQAALDPSLAGASQAQAAVDAAEANLQAARARSGATGPENAGVRAARASLTQTEIALAHATVAAPAAGWITNITLRPGQFVSPGQPLFSLVEDGAWWIDANFKETDIARIRPGQPATVALDMYPGLTLAGEVESIGLGSGAAFSLLPAENATGNWVKVTQRFPIRVRLNERPSDPAMQLRVGASATVTIDTSGLDG